MGSVENICRAVDVAHLGFEQALADARALAESGSWVQAAKRLGELRRHLEEHSRAEDGVLLPSLVEADPSTAEEAASLYAEHRVLDAILQELWESVTRADRATSLAWARQLEVALHAHHLHEERAVQATQPSTTGCAAAV